MLIAVFVKKRSLAGDPRIDDVKQKLSAGGCEVYDVTCAEDLREGTDMLLGLGGDGTYLSAGRIVGATGIPVLGINFGRLGFLSENSAEEAIDAILSGIYLIEERAVLEAEIEGVPGKHYALNEVAVNRNGAATLGVGITIDGEPMPTCWADGFLVATSSGSTAYSLSVGGPICSPDADVLILAPISPHNLNVRPIVVPVSTKISLSLRARNESVMVTLDNTVMIVPSSTTISVSVAQFSLKRIRLEKSNFIQALKSKLFWGEDVRNQ